MSDAITQFQMSDTLNPDTLLLSSNTHSSHDSRFRLAVLLLSSTPPIEILDLQQVVIEFGRNKNISYHR